MCDTSFYSYDKKKPTFNDKVMFALMKIHHNNKDNKKDNSQTDNGNDADNHHDGCQDGVIKQ